MLNVFMFLNGSISLGEFATFISTILLFSNTIWDLVWQVSQYSVTLSRIEEAYSYLFGEANVLKDYSERPVLQAKEVEVKEMLSFVNVNFAYPDKPDVPVIKDFNLDIKKGEKVGIVGRSGSGKTTITKLLLGYYELPSGYFNLDGKSASYRDILGLISYVPQDTVLFHRSIGENIAYGTEREVSDEEIRQQLRKLTLTSLSIKLSRSTMF